MIAAEPARKDGLDENFKSLATRGDRGFLIGQMVLARQRTRRVRSWREASSTDNGHACQPLERRWNVPGSLRPQPDKPPPASEPPPPASGICGAALPKGGSFLNHEHISNRAALQKIIH